jgi:tRNA(fMet)-specific endonuclease VapC
MYVLDTNSVVFFFKGHGRVAARLLARKPAEVALPAIVLYELEVGVIRSTDPVRRREQLDTLLEATRVIPFGPPEARAAARIRGELERSGEGIGPLDTLIAATALASGGTLVTHNTREFRRVRGLSVEDWY